MPMLPRASRPLTLFAAALVAACSSSQAPPAPSADAAAAEAEAQQAFRDQWSPLANVIGGTLGLLLLLGGPGLVYLLWYNKGRDKPVVRVADYLPEPPDTLAPGLAGTLVDDKADMQDVLATIVDLARRKAISVSRVTAFSASQPFAAAALIIEYSPLTL